MTLDSASINKAIQELQDYQKRIEQKAHEMVERLADIGAVTASAMFPMADYDGKNDVSVSVEQRGDTACAVVATGSAVLFIEFGAGITFGYGHPQAGEFGYGPGTYPSEKGHWNDPNGWYIPGGQHTYGNPPSMTMYYTAEEIRDRVMEVAREVFSS